MSVFTTFNNTKKKQKKKQREFNITLFGEKFY